MLEEEPELGQNVLVVDQQGFYQAAGVAELLAGRGKRVEIVSPNLYVGQGLGPTLDLEMWYRRAHQLGITMTPNVTVLSVKGSTVRGVHNYSGREVEWHGVDSVVTAAPNRVNDELYFALKGKVAALYRIGDCLPRRVDAAILKGTGGRRLIGKCVCRRRAWGGDMGCGRIRRRRADGPDQELLGRCRLPG